MKTLGFLTIDKLLDAKAALLWCLVGTASFQLAWSVSFCRCFILLYLWSVFQMTRCATTRQAFYFSLLLGMLASAPQLEFFWRIFGGAAIVLWVIWSFWIQIFVLLARFCRVHCRPLPAAILIPFLWMGFEYFRSELYYLRFSWLSAGLVFSGQQGALPLGLIGVYGVGFLMIGVVSGISLMARERRLPALIGAMVLLAGFTGIPLGGRQQSVRENAGSLNVAGIQMEFPSELEILAGLNELVKAHPEAQLLVLSEYSIDGPVSPRIKTWCRSHSRYLVVGGKDPVTNTGFYNTAFVVGPTGEVVFRQAKSVPIQFFKDGLPAASQAIWDSPWGKLGFCICYDLSYSRVTDRLVRLGAQALIVPTMDVETWGAHEHQLHSLIAPARAAEYALPIFRLASSGISQCVDANGRVQAAAPMTGGSEIISGTLVLPKAGRLPLDRYLAPLAVLATTGWIVCLPFIMRKERTTKSSLANQASKPESHPPAQVEA